jgi:hypothetical protein
MPKKGSTKEHRGQTRKMRGLQNNSENNIEVVPKKSTKTQKMIESLKNKKIRKYFTLKNIINGKSNGIPYTTSKIYNKLQSAIPNYGYTESLIAPYIRKDVMESIPRINRDTNIKIAKKKAGNELHKLQLTAKQYQDINKIRKEARRINTMSNYNQNNLIFLQPENAHNISEYRKKRNTYRNLNPYEMLSKLYPIYNSNEEYNSNQVELNSTSMTHHRRNSNAAAGSNHPNYRRTTYVNESTNPNAGKKMSASKKASSHNYNSYNNNPRENEW